MPEQAALTKVYSCLKEKVRIMCILRIAFEVVRTYSVEPKTNHSLCFHGNVCCRGLEGKVIKGNTKQYTLYFCYSEDNSVYPTK